MTIQAPKTRLRGSQRRELIVDAATAEFAQRGYEAASVGRIATRRRCRAHRALRPLPVQARAVRRGARTSSSRRCSAYLSARARLRGHDARIAGAPPSTRSSRSSRSSRSAWRLLFPSHPPLETEAAEEYRRVRTESNRVLADLLRRRRPRAGLEPRDSPCPSRVRDPPRRAHGCRPLVAEPPRRQPRARWSSRRWRPSGPGFGGLAACR